MQENTVRLLARRHFSLHIRCNSLCGRWKIQQINSRDHLIKTMFSVKYVTEYGVEIAATGCWDDN